jgi:DNA polymerase-3 subunit gamma/tau
MLSREAFNALLKTLEEPPAHVVFILATTEPHKLPDTIRSRCQRFSFERAPVSLLVEKLKKIVDEEGANVPEKDLVEIARASDGGFRDAETLLEQVITGEQKVSDLVGIASLDNLGRFFDFLIAGESAPALVYVNESYDKGVSMEVLNVRILEYLRDLLLVKAGVGESLVDVGEERFAVLQEQAGKLEYPKLRRMIDEFTGSWENLRDSSVPQLPLEVAVVAIGEPPVRRGGGENRGVRESGNQGAGESENRLPVQAGKTKESGSKTSEEPEKRSNSSDHWPELMAAVKPLNHSIAALLRSCEPGVVSGKRLVIRAFYPFHKERLEDKKNIAILEETVAAIYGKSLKVMVELSGR